MRMSEAFVGAAALGGAWQPPQSPHVRIRRAARTNHVAMALTNKAKVDLGGPPGTLEYVTAVRKLGDTFCGPSSEAADMFWEVMRAEAQEVAREEPLLASYVFSSVINHKSMVRALAFSLANKLEGPSFSNTLLMEICNEVYESEHDLCPTIRQDLTAVMSRDPACTRFIDAFLYFKGFHAIQAYRVAHWLWEHERYPLAYYLQAQVSKELQVDIHPAAKIGPGLLIDHATGVVIGETARVGRNVSMLHHVTLGGSGKSHGKRHPTIEDGVLIGAGATILGDIEVGEGAQIGACSLVLEDVPPCSTVVGVPGKIVGKPSAAVPALTMRHDLGKNGDL